MGALKFLKVEKKSRFPFELIEMPNKGSRKSTDLVHISVNSISHELFEATSLVEIAPWSYFNHVITDSKTPENVIEEIRLKTDLIIV